MSGSSRLSFLNTKLKNSGANDGLKLFLQRGKYSRTREDSSALARRDTMIASSPYPPVALFRWALSGAVATIVMDVASVLTSKLTGLTNGIPPKMLATWFGSVVRGRVFTDVVSSDAAPLPILLLAAIHYSIGATFALLFGLAARCLGQPQPAWWVVLLFGWSTTLVPAFFMFPAMGLGILGRAAPTE